MRRLPRSLCELRRWGKFPRPSGRLVCSSFSRVSGPVRSRLASCSPPGRRCGGSPPRCQSDSSNCFQLLSSASTFCPAPSPQPSPGPGSCVWPRWEVDERGVCLFSDPNWFADRWRAMVGLCGCDQTPVPSLETFQAYVTKNWRACRPNGGAPSIPFRPDEVSGAFRVLRFSHCCLKWQVIST